MIKIWLDIKNSHEPAFFKVFLKKFSECEFFVTARDWIEVINLLNKSDIPYTSVGRHYGKNLLKKFIGLFIRDFQLFLNVPSFDISMSHMSPYCIHASKLHLRKTISFTDNEISTLVNKISYGLVDYLITPSAIDPSVVRNQGLSEDKLLQYNGFKEDIYVADYTPNLDFLNEVPFNEFVSLRPESWKAEYYPKGVSSVVPNLLKLLNEKGTNVIYFPRYPEDKAYAKGYENVYIPSEPLNGLDLCYYSKTILTGAGTFAREAACMGTPAVSFFPGKQLLSVDQKMIENGWIFHSRDPKEIVEYVLNSKKRKVDMSRSKKVQKEVFNIVGGILEEVDNKK